MINQYQAIPEQSSAHFNLHNLVIPDVEGDFECLSGSFDYDEDQLDKSSIKAFIDVKTIHTGNESRDEQLKNNFFNVKDYPTIKFISTKIKLVGNELEVSGDLTVKDVTKKVILNVERPKDLSANHLSLAASTIINRDKFNLELGSILEVGEMLVGDDIKIDMSIELSKKS